MTEEDGNYELSRRKTLAALGTIGAAGAGAGLGTSAFFSDQETFTNNQLVAGSLDLKVSWDEHYSDWMGEETEFARMPDEGEEADLSLPPAPGDEQGMPIELVFDDQQGFMDATRQEQFPEGGLGDADPCEALADVPGDLEAPVIDLEDVKPGDFGEVTFDFASCDNPAYLWMNGELVEEAENGVTEPEAEDEDEGEGVELADALRARAWYDDGDGGDDGNGTDDGNDVVIQQNGSLTATSIASSGDTPTDLVKELIANTGDVSLVSGSVTSQGDDIQLGTFSDGGETIDIDSGIILSSGDVEDVEGPNDLDSTETETSSGNDPDLDDLAGGSTEDAAVLEFDFTVPEDADQVFFDYVFGSEEYNEWVGSGFNDVFGFFVNGTNVATIEDPENPDEDVVAINNIHNDENADLYNDNDPGDTGSPFDTEMDGFTDVLDISAAVNPGETNTMKLAIGDTSDSALDSWVLIKGESLSTEPEPEPDGEPGDNIHQDDEEVFVEGSLREVLEELSSDNGLPLEGNLPAEEGGGTGRNCYSAAPDVHYVAFQWWLPIDHGNEVQTDSVTFDLGFYAEQCRHNDGSGATANAD